MQNYITGVDKMEEVENMKSFITVHHDAIISITQTHNNMWHWLCENHPEIAIEYEKHTLTANNNINIVEGELVNNKKELV